MNPEIAIRGVGLLLAVLAGVAAAVFGVWLLVQALRLLFTGTGKAFRGVAALIEHVFTCLKGIVIDSLRYVGSCLTAVVFLPLVLVNIALGRWSAATHFGRAAGSELSQAVLSLYRATLGHPLRLIGLSSLVAGFEERIPEVIARAPGSDRPVGGRASFEGYEVVGSLPPGGSGAKLYLALVEDSKEAQLTRAGLRVPERVVIKSFSLDDGSTLPQIVRESRALEAARDLGLVLEHELTPTSFHYVMPFVPGDDLGEVGRGLHAASGPEGLKDSALRAAIGYSSGLLGILSRFHRAGLWHKDIKPNNIIVAGDRVELVDLGLVTPLASAMTLTTHGTEYYRDPELVRQAMQGVKVQDVDGVKFDLYSTGAVLYNLIENEFPAHGSLSKITRRCPDALRWIIRRSMADLRNRYVSADEMLADLRVLLAAPDPFAVKPAQLPSMGGTPIELPDEPVEDELEGLRPRARLAADAPQAQSQPEPARPKGPPPHRRRRRTTPMGFLGFVGVTVAVLALPMFLGLLVLGVSSGGVKPSATVVSYSGPGGQWGQEALPPAPMVPASFAAFFGDSVRSEFDHWPSRPPVPALTIDPKTAQLLSIAPAAPAGVREALASPAPPRDREWISEAEHWVDQVEHWLDVQEHHLEATGERELGLVVLELEDWIDGLDGWLADLEHDIEGSVRIEFSDAARIEPPALPAGGRKIRALLLASGPGAVSKAARLEFESRLVDSTGWELVSDLVDVGDGERRGDELELLSKAHLISNLSPITDSAVNVELGERLLEPYALDAILRYEWDSDAGQPRIHVVHGPGADWVEGALVEALRPGLATAAR